MRFQNKSIVLGLTGGIAIYKVAQLLRRLVHDEGAEVQVIMTTHAQEFMSPLIFETFSGKAVITDMFLGHKIATRHIDLATNADAVLVCPATANILAKTVAGLADDMLSTVILTAGAKTIFVPAMNTAMYLNPITQANLAKLKALGYGILEPAEGPLACNTEGKGRLPDENSILAYLDQRLNGKRRLTGKKVIVTAGATRAYLDPIRFISNRSTGKMGYALAEVAVREDAQVILISGPTNLAQPWGTQLITVETVEQMQQALEQAGDEADYLFMAAAVEDLIPQQPSQTKIKKANGFAPIAVSPAPDLIQEFRTRHPKTCIIGFSVEMEDGAERSVQKLQTKGLDFIVWNNPNTPGAAFVHDTNEVTMFAADGSRWNFPLASKRLIAEQIVDAVLTKLGA